MNKSLLLFLCAAIVALAMGLDSPAILPGAILIAALMVCLVHLWQDLLRKRRFRPVWAVSSLAILVVLTVTPLGRIWLGNMVRPFVIRSLERRLKANPGETVTLQHLSTIQTTRKDEAKAMPLIEELLKRNPCDGVALSNRALLARFSGHLQRSLADCRTAVNCDTLNPLAWEQLGFAHAALEQPDSARACWDAALRTYSDPNSRERIEKHLRGLAPKPR